MHEIIKPTRKPLHAAALFLLFTEIFDIRINLKYHTLRQVIGISNVICLVFETFKTFKRNIPLLGDFDQ